MDISEVETTELEVRLGSIAPDKSFVAEITKNDFDLLVNKLDCVGGINLTHESHSDHIFPEWEDEEGEKWGRVRMRRNIQTNQLIVQQKVRYISHK